MGHLFLSLLAFFTWFEQNLDYELKLIFLTSIASGSLLLASRRQKLLTLPFLIPLFSSYLLVNFLTILFSAHPYLSLLKSFEYLALFLFIIFLVSFLKKVKTAHFLITGIIFIGVITSLQGIGDYLQQDPTNPLGHLLRQPLGWHTAMAGFLILIIPLAWSRLIISFSLANKKILALFLLANTTLAVAFLLTYSRAAFLSLGLGLTVFFALLWVQRIALKTASKPLFFLIILVLVIFWPLRSGYGLGKINPEKLVTTAGYATNVQRIATYKTALTMISDKPFLGGGAGTFGDLFRKYQNQPWLYSSLAHNQYLEIGAEAGLPALILFLAIIGLPFYLFFTKKLKLEGNREETLIKTGLISAIISFLAFNFLTSSLSVLANSFLFWLEYGLLIALIPGGKQKIGALFQKSLVLLSIITLFSTVILTWHYVSFKRIKKMVKKTTREETLINLSQELSQLHQILPNEKYLLWKAQISSQLKDNSSAIEKLLEAQKSRPYDPEPLFRAGQLEYETQNYPQASAYLETVISLNPYTSIKHHLLLANTYLKLGEKEKAEQTLKKALNDYFPKNRFYRAYQYIFDTYGDTAILETMEKLLEAVE